MNTLKIFAVVLLFSFTGCLKSPTANSSRTSPSPDKTAPASPGGGADFGKAVSDFNGKYYDQALAGFQKVLESNPNDAEALFYIGRIYEIRQDWPNSVTYYEKAAKIDYKSVDKLMALGEMQRKLKKYDVAIVQYQKIQGFDPKNANAYYGAGMTYIGLNNKIAARQQLQKLEPLDKGLAEKLSKEIDGLK